MITATQQDYIEIIHRLEKENGRGNTRISDIAAEFGTRLPTVSRTVGKLTELGFVAHRQRRSVSLTEKGRTIAREILHRHTDTVRFLTEILGLPETQAEIDAGQIEHGLSPATAQRLHEFLNHIDTLTDSEREPLRQFLKLVSGGKEDFRNLPTNKIEGWRI